MPIPTKNGGIKSRQYFRPGEIDAPRPNCKACYLRGDYFPTTSYDSELELSHLEELVFTSPSEMGTSTKHDSMVIQMGIAFTTLHANRWKRETYDISSMALFFGKESSWNHAVLFGEEYLGFHATLRAMEVTFAHLEVILLRNETIRDVKIATSCEILIEVFAWKNNVIEKNWKTESVVKLQPRLDAIEKQWLEFEARGILVEFWYWLPFTASKVASADQTTSASQLAQLALKRVEKEGWADRLIKMGKGGATPVVETESQPLQELSNDTRRVVQSPLTFRPYRPGAECSEVSAGTSSKGSVGSKEFDSPKETHRTELP